MTTWQAIIPSATQSSQATGSIGATELTAIGSVRSAPAFTSILRPIARQAASAWKWLERTRTQQLSTRRLRVAETVQLGEKRFVSILQVDGEQYLIGGAAGHVALLAVLGKDQLASQAAAPAEAKR